MFKRGILKDSETCLDLIDSKVTQVTYKLK